MEKKKWIELLGSVFVAVIFLSSYAAFSNKSVSTNTTTTITQSPTFLAEAKGTARVLSYAPLMTIMVQCKDASNVTKQINDFLNTQNKSVVALTPYPGENSSQTVVTSGELGTYYLYNSVSENLGANANCTEFSTAAEILLPSSMSFVALQESGSAVIQLPGEFRNYSMPVLMASDMANTMNVLVYAILTENGAIHGQNITVKRA